MILDAKDRDKKEYEIHVKTPSWPLTKYILTETAKFTGPDIDESKLKAFYDEILKECLIKWKFKGDTVWHKEADRDMPATVTAAIVRALIRESRTVADVKVRTEKN